MQLELSLRQPLAKIALVAIASIASALVGFLVIAHFVVGSLTDPRATLTRNDLFAAARQFPNSPVLQALVAEAEIAQASDHEGSVARAEAAASRAVALTPARYKYHLLLAAARELHGNRAGAEAALREALTVSPERTEIHWRLANLLVREGKIDEAVGHFNRVVSAHPRLLSQTFSLIWNVSGGDVAKLTSAAGQTVKARSDLAFFLLRQNRLEESVRVFEGIDRKARFDSDESAPYITGLMTIGQLELARRVWGGLVAERGEELSSPVWNGSFEADLQPKLNNFDWVLASNKWARVLIDPGTGHTGTRSLRVDFLGIDTPQINGEIRQQIVVRQGRRYRLSCFVKTQELSITEGPRLVVTSIDGTQQFAFSAPVAAGTNDWTPLGVDFTVPASFPPTVLVTVKRIPQFSYDKPARGAIWFDDFTLVEAGEK